MEKISNVIDIKRLLAINAEKTEKAEKISDQLDPRAVELVNRLFTFFYSVCRGFEKQYHEPKKLSMEKTQWMRAFQDEGLVTFPQILPGIKRVRRETPINTPTIGQFIDYCTPTDEALGVPTLDEAYREACKNSYFAETEKVWTHKLVHHAWKLTGAYNLASCTRDTSYPIFRRNYEITIRDWRAGKAIEEIHPLKAIKNNLNRQTPEIAEKSLQALKDMLK